MGNNFYENYDQNISPENVQFIISSDLALLLKTHEKLGDMTKNYIDTMNPLKLNEKMVFLTYPYLKRAIRRGIKIRIITQKIDEIPTLTKS